MNNQNIQGAEQAQKILLANTTPRAREISEYENERNGTRYDCRKPWTDDAPIYDKRPCVIYTAVDSAINSHKDLLLGEGRFPTITARPEEDEDDESEEDGLGEDDSEELDKFILSVLKEAKLKHLFREMYSGGQDAGTSVALCGVRRGRLFAETLLAKFATPTYDAKGELEQVEILYPYQKLIPVDDGWLMKCYLYRRVINRQQDITYLPGEANAEATPPKWKPDPNGTIDHGLGFVPVIWYKHDAPQMNVAGYDGNPIHKNLLLQLEQMHYALSQRQHGALHALPQIFEIGVDIGFNPTEQADTGRMTAGIVRTQANPGGVPQFSTPAAKRSSRKKGPNHVWQYESAETKVGAINTPGDALKAIDDNIKDLRNKICETLAWVPLDPDSIKFAATVSGKALEILRERELNRVSQDRECFGEDVILGVVNMLLRISLAKAKELQTPRLKRVTGLLGKFKGADGSWQDPRLTLKWPSFFVPSAEDDKNLLDATKEAYDSGFITKQTAVEAIARIYGISNIPEYVEKLEEEAEEKRQQMQDDMAQSMAKFHTNADGSGTPGRGNPPKGTPSGSRGAGSSAGNPAKAKAAQPSAG